MSDILVLNEQKLRELVVLDGKVVDVVEEAFAALARGGVVMPPVLSMPFEEVNGEVDVKTAYIPGFDAFAIKISPGFFDNPKLGLPSLNGLMVVLSARTGLVEAVLLDNGYLTNVRTAAAGAVATRHLAPVSVTTAGVIGAGVQARLQVRAAHLERHFEHVLLWSPNARRSDEAAAEIETSIGVPVTVTDNAQSVVAGSELVITATPATEPVVRREWLHSTLHITCMGADQQGKNEIDPEALAVADLYVCDFVSQAERLGELRSARARGLLADVRPPELGAVITGTSQGRRRDKDITICDLTGTGAQDTAIANVAVRRAVDAGAGTTFRR
ncbi:MAG: cyclodeaminase [Gammaproteobacteria bacterium]|nr:cyclodeaminase [Gammaproteobacteria bacterium]